MNEQEQSELITLKIQCQLQQAFIEDLSNRIEELRELCSNQQKIIDDRRKNGSAK